MIAQGNPMPVPYGEMLVGSRRISQDISTRDEGGDGKGGGYRAAGIKAKKSRSDEGCGNRK